MGCGSSKAAQVVSCQVPLPAPGGQPTVGEQQTRTVVVETSPPSPTPSTKSTTSTASRRQRRNGCDAESSDPKNIKRHASNPSLASLRAEEKAKREEIGRSSSRTSLSENGGQETKLNALNKRNSQYSVRTDDSGLGDDVITERSSAEKRAAVEKEQRPPTPELCITGQALQDNSRTYSAGSRRSLPGRLRPPDNETSIIQRPASRGGMAFEVLLASPDTGNKPRPPSRMRDVHRERSHSAHVSGEKLRAKMAAAEQRRQQYEQERVFKKVAIQRQRNEQVQKALQDFAARQANEGDGQLNKLAQTAEKREAHLKALRTRLQEKEAHAAKVRQSKLDANAPPVAVH